MGTIEWAETGDTMKWVRRVGLTTQTGWDRLGCYGSRSARKSHIIFRRDFGLGHCADGVGRGGW